MQATALKNFKITSGGQDVDFGVFRFSDGAIQVKVTAECLSHVEITAHIRTSDDIMTLLMLTDALRREFNPTISLVLPYVPYARQDRVCSRGEALSLKVFCDLINSQKYYSVRIADPHSDVTGALLDNLWIFPQDYFVREASYKYPSLAHSILVAPDAGALKKINACAKVLGTTYIRADKTRDPSTGEITGTQVIGDVYQHKSYLILDDICDGGRTFIELAKELRKQGALEVNLFVTHGIFSKGLRVFDGCIDNVFTPNPFITLPEPTPYDGSRLTNFYKTKGI